MKVDLENFSEGGKERIRGAGENVGAMVFS